VLGEVCDAAARFASWTTVPRPVRHKVPNAEVALNALVGIALQAGGRGPLDAKQRGAVRVAPPAPPQLTAVAQRQHAVLERDSVVGVLEGVLHFMAHPDFARSHSMRNPPSLRTIFRIFRCLSHFDIPSTRRN